MDVMIVGRGGGSVEDLWAFNEELVARAIFECSVPVISAVGHETDITIADYVADLRAPTPSAAAELAVYDIRELEAILLSTHLELNRRISEKLERSQERVQQYGNRLRLLSPENQLNEKRQTVADLQEKLFMRMVQKLTEKKHEMELYAGRLEAFSPVKKLSTGYSFVTDEKGKNVRDVDELHLGELLQIHMLNGKVKAQVQKIEHLERVIRLQDADTQKE